MYIKEIFVRFNLLLLLPATLESEPRIIQNPVKERAPFCKIDFDTLEGEATFSEAVDALVEMLFDRIKAHNEKRSVTNVCSKTESARKRPVNTWTWGWTSMNSIAENSRF